MTALAARSLEEVIRSAGEGWILDSFAPASHAMERIHHLLQQVNAQLTARFGGSIATITEAAIVDEYRRSAHKIHAFIQALGQTESPEMLMMVWRILQGMEIQKMDLHYEMTERFEMIVTLISPGGAAAETYRSEDIDDAALLRHLGIMKMSGKPIFDGFYTVPWAQ